MNKISGPREEFSPNANLYNRTITIHATDRPTYKAVIDEITGPTSMKVSYIEIQDCIAVTKRALITWCNLEDLVVGKRSIHLHNATTT